MKLSELKNQLKELDQSIKAMVVTDLDLAARLRKLPPKSEWQDDEMMVAQVKMMLDEKHQVSVRRTDEDAEYERLKHEIENYYLNNQIEAHNHIFANVELHIGPAFNRTLRETRHLYHFSIKTKSSNLITKPNIKIQST